MVAAGASAGSSIDEFGIRLRVRGSSVSRKPVSRKSPLSPIRQEMPSAGSRIEKTTVHPPLWRENIAIGALTESDGVGELRCTGGSAAICCGGLASSLVASLVASLGVSDSLAMPLRKT